MKVDPCALFLVAASAFSLLFPISALAEPDACELLTPAQVAAAIGGAVSPGTHVTKNSFKTCTWTPKDQSKVRAVTLNLQNASTYDGAKHMAEQMAGLAGAIVTRVSVADDAYYFIRGTQVDIWARKGGHAFKISVYAQLPVEDIKAAELALARQAVAKL